MTTQAHHVGARDMTPEQVGMLNGRAAALQAATADLLERGYPVSYTHLTLPTIYSV